MLNLDNDSFLHSLESTEFGIYRQVDFTIFFYFLFGVTF